MSNYLLKHDDDTVAQITLGPEGQFNDLVSIKDDVLMPVGTKDRKSLAAWWDDRSVSKSQSEFLRKIRDNGYTMTSQFLMMNLAVSMTDHYWICPQGSTLQWKDVSPFSNEFSPVVIPMTKASSDIHSVDELNPNASSQGQMEKRWAIRDGKRVLYKYHAGNHFSAINEVFASRLYDDMGLKDHVVYELAVKDGHLCSVCEAFTSEEVEFVSAYELCGRRTVNYQAFIDNAVNLAGLDEDYVRRFMDVQTQMDYLISNSDRHMNNFGFLRSSKDLKYVGMAPVFDNDRSMIDDRLFSEKGASFTQADILTQKANTFKTLERDNLKRILPENLRLVDLSLVPSGHDIRDFYRKHLKYYYNDIIGDTLTRQLQMKTHFLQMVQDGKSLGEYFASLTGRPRECSTEEVNTDI